MATNSKGMNQPGTDMGERGETGEKIPGGAKSKDGSGERSGRINGGVGMGTKDATGTNGQFNTGRTSGTCYTHKKAGY